MKLKTVLFSHIAAYGNLPGIRDALSRWSETLDPIGVVVVNPDSYGFHETCLVASKSRKDAVKMLKQAEAFWLGGYGSLSLLGHYVNMPKYLDRLQKKMVFLSDSHYMNKSVKGNRQLKQLGFSPVFCMPDLVHLREGLPTVSLYQPQILFEPVKSARLVVGHSPGARMKTNPGKKGSLVIIPVLERLSKRFGFDVLVMKDMTNEQCIQAKRRCAVFVDSLPPNGGIGKSGLEALSCGCAVLSTMCNAARDNVYSPPVVPVESAEDLERELVRLLSCPGELKKQRALSMEWRKEISQQAFAGRVDDAVRS